MKSAEVDRLASEIYEYGKLRQHLVPADAIVALCNMDLRIAKRAAELWHQKLAPVVVASGGVGRLTPETWSKSEAATFANELYSLGVPKESIFIEEGSTNIPENIKFALEALRRAGLKTHRLILATLPFAERRIAALCKKQFPDIEIQMTSPDILYANYANETIDRTETVNLIVGELERLYKYPAKGFIVTQVIPQDILAANERLINAGFKKYEMV